MDNHHSTPGKSTPVKSKLLLLMNIIYLLLTHSLLEENFASTWVEEETFVLKHIANKKVRRIKEVPATESAR
jgi:hypothetical protein